MTVVNVALPTFAAACLAAAPCCCGASRYLLPAKPTVAAGKCDRQMNRHRTVTQTLLCIAYYADSANRTETLEKLLRILYNECTSVTKQCLKYKMQKK